MRKKETPFLDYYRDCMEHGKVKATTYVFRSDIYYLFAPELDDEIKFTKNHWKKHKDEFTPMRQTCILFMAAINGEI